MDNILDQLPRNGRVAAVRLRSLGDCVLTTPALAILKRTRPDLRVAVLVEPRFRGVFEDHPDVDDLLPVELAPLRRFHPDLCLNLHGGTRSAWLTAGSGARFRAGFAHFRHRFVYNLHIPRAQEILHVDRTVHTAEHLASAMFWLGAAPCEIPRAALASKPAAQPARPLAVIHPVAATPEKTWRADGFLAVADRLQSTGIEPVFIGANPADLAPFQQFRTLAGAPLDEVKSLLASASLFIGNDSGPAHMAAAFGLPVVVIFGPSNPAIWGPWRTTAEILPSSAGIDQVIGALARLRVHA